MVGREIKTSEGLVWTGLGVSICILAWKFELGSFGEPGPGFIAFLAGLALVGVGLIMVFSPVFSKRLESGPTLRDTLRTVPWRRLTYTMGLLLGYVLFLNLLGFMLATFILMWGMAYDWERKNRATSLLFSVITVLISYLVFEIWLKCQLPRGIFPWW